MIGMAARAVEPLRLRQPAVKAGILSKVVADLRMTGDAEFALWYVRKRCMACAAVFFKLRVAAGNRGRHDQPFLNLRCLSRL